MFKSGIFRLSFECSMRQHLICIDITFEFASHSEIIDKKRSLVNVLKETESTILEGKLEAILEVLVSIDAYLFRTFFNLLIGKDLHIHGGTVSKHMGVSSIPNNILNIFSVEAKLIVVSPFKLIVSEFQNAFSVIKFISAGFCDTKSHVVFSCYSTICILSVFATSRSCS